MGAQPLSLTLLEDDPLESPLKRLSEGHVSEPSLGVGDREQARELAPRPSERDGTDASVGLDGAGLGLGAVDELAKLLGEVAVAAARGLGGDLHGHRVEARVVALRVRAYQRLDLVGLGHAVLG